MRIAEAVRCSERVIVGNPDDSLVSASAKQYDRGMEPMLKKLGWTKAELARRLGLQRTTVSAWGADAPQYAVAYLALALELKALRDMAGKSLEKTK